MPEGDCNSDGDTGTDSINKGRHAVYNNFYDVVPITDLSVVAREDTMVYTEASVTVNLWKENYCDVVLFADFIVIASEAVMGIPETSAALLGRPPADD